jgi:hypothetical protein
MPYNEGFQFQPIEPNFDYSKSDKLPGMVKQLVEMYNDSVYKLNSMQEALQRSSAGSTTTLVQASASGAGGGSGSGVLVHDILSTTHGDVDAAAAVLGDTIAANATPHWQRIAGNITSTRKFYRQTGTGVVSNLPTWDTILAADIPASALTKVDDLNVTLTLGGSPSVALLAATSITVNWSGTLAAGRLNSNVVQSVTNDANITGVIAAQNLTLGWTGQLSVVRGGTGASSFTQGSVIFAGATTLAEDNANLFWDDTRNVLLHGLNSATEVYVGYLAQNNVQMEIAYGSATAGNTPYSGLVISKNLTGTANLLGTIQFANTALGAVDKRLVQLEARTNGATNEGMLRISTNAAGTVASRYEFNSLGLLTSGYTRIGSSSAPANTTAGDLTLSRLNIGNSAFGTDILVQVIGTGTATSGTVQPYYFQTIYSPSGASTATYLGFTSETRPTGANDFVTIAAGFFLNRLLSSSNATTFIGSASYGTYGSTSTNFGTITDSLGIQATGTSLFTNNPTGTITRSVGIRVENSSKGGAGVTIVNSHGITIRNQTVGGTGNVNLNIGASSPSGNWSIYSDVAYDNYLQGNLRIGVAGTPAREISIIKSAANAGIQMQSSGGSGKTYAIISTTSGNLDIQTDSGTTSLLRIQSAGTFLFYKADTSTVVGLDNGTAGVQAYLNFADAGTTKWQIGKQTDNTLFMWDNANSRNFLTVSTTGNATLSSKAGSIITQAVNTSGTPILLKVTGAAHTTLAASTEAKDVYFNLNRTVQWATGALALQRAVHIEGPTWAFVGASTISEAIGLEVDAPIAGTNATFTKVYALNAHGHVLLDSSGADVFQEWLESGAPTSWRARLVNADGTFRIEDYSTGSVINNMLFSIVAGVPYVGIGIGSIPSATLHINQATLGSDIFRLVSTATNDDPTESTFQNRVATTDATVTTIHTFTPSNNQSFFVEAKVVARRTGGAAGAADDGAAYIVYAICKKNAGTLTVITTSTTTIGESQAGWNADSIASGASLLIRVTGAVNNNVTWHMTARTWAVGS